MKGEEIGSLIVVSGNLYRRSRGEACSSGSDVCLEADLSDLSPHVQRIDVVALSKEGLPDIENISSNITVYRTSESGVSDKIKELNRTVGGYDFLLTQLLLSDVAILTANEVNIPVVYMFRSLGVKLDFSPDGRYRVDIMTALSRYVADEVSKQYGGRKVELLPFSLGDRKRIIGEKNLNPAYDVTIFNPTENKGGRIFVELVKRFPELKFCAVRGWMDLKDPDGNYNSQLMRLMEQAHTGQSEKVYVPVDLELPELPNLTIIPPQYNIGEIYQNTKLVIVPSQWDEALARVVIEAALNGRIVLASKTAGIPEAMEIGGYPNEYLVDDFSNIETWEKKLRWYLENANSLPTPKPVLPNPDLHKILLKYKKAKPSFS